jgi:hypothetical protein
LTQANASLDKPAEDPEAIGDPYKTLFIARLVMSFFVDSKFVTHSDQTLAQGR